PNQVTHKDWPDPSSLGRLERAAARTAIRLRLREQAGRAFAWLPLALIFAVGALTFIKVARPTPSVERALGWASLLLLLAPIGACLYGLLRRRPNYLGARA